MEQFHEHFSMVKGLLPIQPSVAVGSLQIPRSIKFLYTYSTLFTNHQDLIKHMGGTHTGERDLAQNTCGLYAKYDRGTHV